MQTNIFSLPFVYLHELEKLPELEGVYFLVDKLEDSFLYIGYSSNLSKRWASHGVFPKLLKYLHNKSRSIPQVVLYYELFTDSSVAAWHEQAYIVEKMPLFNLKHTKGSPNYESVFFSKPVFGLLETYLDKLGYRGKLRLEGTKDKIFVEQQEILITLLRGDFCLAARTNISLGDLWSFLGDYAIKD